MKKIIYNENTKEIDVMEKEHMPEKDEKKTRKVRKCLEENKIFFDIFSTFCVGIMSAVISLVGWKTNQRSADIYQRQLEILDSDREPYFILNSETIYQKLDKDGYYIQKICSIKNEGGLITSAFIKDFDSYACVHISNKNNYKSLNFKYTIEDRVSIPSGKNFYSEDTKEFIFYKTINSDYEDFETALEEKLNKILSEYDIYINFEDYIEIYYINYKNEEYAKRYRLLRDSIAVDEGDDRIFINIKQRDDIELIAQEILEHVRKWEG